MFFFVNFGTKNRPFFEENDKISENILQYKCKLYLSFLQIFSRVFLVNVVAK
jgi:hypothetical protein